MKKQLFLKTIKSIIALVALLSINTNLYSQLNYTFSTASVAYAANATPTTIHASAIDDALSAAINIGFTFNYQCVNYTQIKVSSNGWLTFNTAVTANNAANNLNTSSDRPIIAPLWDDLATGSAGNVNYKLTGVVGSRVLTVEWNQMEWSYSGTVWALSFQVKLYETTNVIEFKYLRNGTAGANIVSASASIGISGSTSGQFYSLDGVGAAPTASTVTETTTLATKPATNQVYRFTPAAACSGSPSAGTATPSPAAVCSGLTSTITLTGFSTGCGISYQWQSSPDNSVWTNIGGATSTSYVATITALTYFRCITTCSNGGGTNTSSVATVNLSAPSSCYCTPAPTSVDGTGITNVTCGTINNTTGAEAGNYGNYSAQIATFAQLASVPVDITFSTGYTYETKIWVDWNDDGDFADAGEEVYSGTSLATNPTTLNASFVIPITAPVGNHRMRIGGADTGPPTPCYTGTYASYEDYTLNVTATGACAGTPTAGTTSASPNPICSGSTSVVTLAGYTVASGITFQWQSSPDNAAWTDIVGATSSTYTTPALATSTYYRCRVTCTNSSLSANSTSTQVVVSLMASCYCVSAATSTSDMDITGVTFGTINNTTPTVSLVGSQGTATGTAGLYSNFWGSAGVPIPSVQQGSTNALSVIIGGTAYSHRVDIYIDFNRDGDLVDAGESFAIFAYANPALPNTTNTNITIPITATVGSTLMRVHCVESSAASPCGTYTYGETEDYQINITAAPACAGTPTPGTTSASPNPICSGATSVVTLAGYSIATNLTFQWQSSPDNAAWTDIVGATSTTYTTPALVTSTYYRCRVTCTNSGLSANSTSTQVVVSLMASCYCTSGATSSADMDITGVTFGTINNTTPAVSLVGSQGTATGTAGMYSNFWGSAGVPIPSVMQGSTNALSVIIGGTAYSHRVDVYIDFNRDGDLIDAGESFAIFAYANPTLPNTTNTTISIPITATVGNTLMRVHCVESSTASPCGTYTWGETEDYLINITAAPACAGAPAGGTAAASPTPICDGETSTLSLTGYTVATGITFQWQSSPDNSTWSDIAGATSSNYTTPALSSSTYYRCRVTCTASGLSANSSSVQVVVQLIASCYCVSSATSTSDMDITRVSFGGMNNTGAVVDLVGSVGTATGTAGMYSNFYNVGTSPSVQQGSTNALIVRIGGTAYSHRVDVYFDFNQDGDLIDAGESFPVFAYANPALPNSTTVNITIPITALTGSTLMRVVCVESSASNACGTYTWGETEDYMVNITAAPPCAGAPTAGTTAASPTPICSGATSTITLSGFTIASGITFQWQSSPDNATWTDIAGATSTTYTTPALLTSTYYRCRVTCTVSGLSANSTSVQVVVQLIASCYCTSSATSTSDMDITRVTFGTINNTTPTVSLVGSQGTATGTAGMYSNFWGSAGVPIPSVMQGSTNAFSVIIGGTAYSHRVDVYIDFNRDGDLIDAGESFAIFAYANPALPNTTNSSITIPITATVGNTLMRVVCVESSSSNSCGTYTWGETEDYLINITAAAPCAGAPAAGTASASPSPICAGATSTITLTGYTIATGITFQWQSAPALGGPWTNIAGATSTTYVSSAVSTTYYRCISTCANGGATATSTVATLTLNPPTACYCASSATSTGDMDIREVNLGTISNNTPCVSLTGTQGNATGTAGMYSNFRGSAVPVPNCEQGTLVPISVTINSCGTDYSHAVYVFVDFNQDGDFTETNEKFTIFAYANPGTHTINSNISIPSSATLGNTVMRILCVESSTFSDPCGTYTWGETEDYTINIIAGVTPMTFVSCTATQPNITGVGQGSSNKEIICMEVVTNGMLSPLALTEFRIRTDGTTNNFTDIQNAKVWYTGLSGTFAPTTQFGATVASPPAAGTNMLFNGSLTLAGGTNYFWLTYDITPTATVANVVDADFQRVTVSGNHTPTVGAPAGSRPITLPTPTNDDPCGATLLAVNVGTPSYQTGSLITTTTASVGIPVPGCGSLGPDIWFKAIVPANGQLIIDMDETGGPTDMDMAWYTSTTNDCANIDNLVECDASDSQNGLMAMICRSGVLCTVPGDCAQNATLTPGTTVYVRTWENGGGTFGNFLIGAYEPNAPGAPSICATAEVISSVPFTGSNTTCCRGNAYDSGDGCGSLYQDGENYLYKYTPAANEIIDITLNGTSTYTGVFVTDNCPTTAGVNCIASQTSATGNPMLCGVSLTAGTTYYIMVDTDPGPNCTAFNITINSSSTPTCNMSYSVSTTAYNWETYFGTNIVLPIDDRFCDTYIPIGFSSCYDGYQYTGLLVSSNGYLIFDPIGCTTNLPSTNAAPNTYSEWSISAAIPNTTDAPRNAILGPWHDIDPAQGGIITYGVLGTAPNRRIIVTWADAPLYSSSCGQIINQQVKIFETTNNIEIHLRDKVYCTSWNSGAAIMGLHNYNGTLAVVPAGYNYPTNWTATNEAWRFTYSCPSCITPLPIELKNFNGKNEGPINKLWWSTLTETNNEYFVIEKFINREFQEIGRVTGAGNSNSVMNYEFFDDNVTQPTSYYKLKQVDYDGRFKYSDIISVNKPITFKQNIYPNPAIDMINVLLGSDVESVKVVIYDNLGKEKISTVITVNSSSFVLDVTNLLNGMYTLKVFDIANNEIFKDKIVISRQ